ncbi:Monoacylglycerol lipase protein ABHD12 [Kalmanozyma brasiliensis GHG001]|uniref:Monoacylglycerol lipase protein ABHD12 n=1 Tax=Kalmanozyma brasiliensis (strain GHG001) TaxID=1365824 RepID=UPI002867DB06|nr:Monoacylglycerol lipase protein ABHD12 [Kalmanozyma brasiliensis GHG001]KAF6767179.1 Monoacylglycerol lipase protein ABHD12 [Kalmanozyma brasiliensis GHG001]
MSTKPPSSISPSSSSTLLRRTLTTPLTLCSLYLSFFLLLLTPPFQRHFIFLHAISFPFFPTYHQPSRYGLAPFKTRPLHLTTADNERIGAWHILPESFYQTRLSSSDEGWGEDVYELAMREYPTVLYLHGNSMNRAAPFRIAAYSALTARMDVNVVAIDYRGFGDSSGTPSEEGLVEDAETAYRWIRAQQRGAQQGVTIFGQSLGTGVGALLAVKLEHQATPVDGLVLMAPYTNLKSLVKDFRLGGFLPLLKPIGAIPFHNRLLDRFLQTQLNTLAALPTLTDAKSSRRTSIVLLHARDDPVIPIDHSRRLFDTLLDSTPASVQERTIRDYAHVKRFHKVTLIETLHGGHNQLTEGALDLVRLALRLPSPHSS